MFIDTHCHLYFFENLAEVIERAKKVNVNLMFCASTDFASLEKVKAIAEQFPDCVKALYSLHPCNVITMDEETIEKGFAFIEENVKGSAGIGETGLDFKYADTKELRELQREIFRKHIAIAKKCEKAIVVHSRRAQEDAVKILLEEGKTENVLMHWLYTESDKLLRIILDNKMFISIGPIIFFSENSRKFVEKIPLENLVLETDASIPFTVFNKQQSEPAWIPRVAKKVAELRGVGVDEIEKAAEENSLRLFGLENFEKE